MPTRISKITVVLANYLQVYETTKTLLYYRCKWKMRKLLENSLTVYHKVKHTLDHMNPMILRLSIYAREMNSYVHAKTCMLGLITFLIIAQC